MHTFHLLMFHGNIYEIKHFERGLLNCVPMLKAKYSHNIKHES